MFTTRRGMPFHASVPCGEGHFEQTRELLGGLTECAYGERTVAIRPKPRT